MSSLLDKGLQRQQRLKQTAVHASFIRLVRIGKRSLSGRDITRLIWGIVFLHGKQLHYSSTEQRGLPLKYSVWLWILWHRPEAKHEQMVLICTLFVLFLPRSEFQKHFMNSSLLSLYFLNCHGHIQWIESILDCRDVYVLFIQGKKKKFKPINLLYQPSVHLFQTRNVHLNCSLH